MYRFVSSPRLPISDKLTKETGMYIFGKLYLELVGASIAGQRDPRYVVILAYREDSSALSVFSHVFVMNLVTWIMTRLY